ncbi:uncharacterized protein LOC106153440 [Lingula anatina]|uniref:Uncharacterized protein LOC106153440 n=1 Tax=Lingula anatina TaxID=7574 RepID=A0A2R2MPP3_LINAN|nr:uncharacterized protein LOC106153440 [Lingula anatina]|eukprot:XP_023932211.1 uncharacterized protein LOC106153440 [Lingula anatina]
MSVTSTDHTKDVASDVIIRPAKLEDLDELYEFTDKVDWRVSKETLKLFLEIVEDGHYLVADLHGKIIGSRLVIILDDKNAMFDFFIVDPKYRGSGVAKKIAARTMEIAGDRNVMIWSVSYRIQQNLKTGMKIGGGRLHLCEGRFDIGTLRVDTTLNDSAIKVVPTSEVDFEALLAYDTSIIVFQREKFLKAWLAKPSAASFAALTDGGEVVGYGQVQDAPRSKVISPLYADNPAAFKLLLKALLESIPMEYSVYMLINVDYGAGMEVINMNKGTVKVFPDEPGTFMYTKRNLEMPKFGNVFAVACWGAFPA